MKPPLRHWNTAKVDRKIKSTFISSQLPTSSSTFLSSWKQKQIAWRKRQIANKVAPISLRGQLIAEVNHPNLGGEQPIAQVKNIIFQEQKPVSVEDRSATLTEQLSDYKGPQETQEVSNNPGPAMNTGPYLNQCVLSVGHSMPGNLNVVNPNVVNSSLLKVKEIFVMYKSQLQEYSQKAGLMNPVYEHVKEGAPHEPRFQSTVCVNGQSYASAPGYPNLRAAEHAAAKVALDALLQNSQTLGVVPSPVHESGLCKNLLQEFAQKNGYPLPDYKIMRQGGEHAPIFTSTVEIAGVNYSGGGAKNKKEAEINAARTALLAIQANQSGAGGLPVVDLFPQAPQSGQVTKFVKNHPKRKKRKRGPPLAVEEVPVGSRIKLSVGRPPGAPQVLQGPVPEIAQAPKEGLLPPPLQQINPMVASNTLNEQVIGGNNIMRGVVMPKLPPPVQTTAVVSNIPGSVGSMAGANLVCPSLQAREHMTFSTTFPRESCEPNAQENPETMLSVLGVTSQSEAATNSSQVMAELTSTGFR